MSLGDAMSRIGAIQDTISQVSGVAWQSSPTAVRASTASAATSAPAVPGSVATPASSIPPTIFSQALQTAVETTTQSQKTNAPQPATVAPAEIKAKRPVSPVAEPPATAGGADGTAVVAAAKKYLGVPYVWGGNNPNVGLDCSSFVQHTFKDLGISLPRVARQQAKEGTEVPSLAQAKPGDLIVTRGGGHIGIYLGDNKMIHAPRPGETVSIRELFETDATIMTIRRIVPAVAPATAETASGNSTNPIAVENIVATAQRALFENQVVGA
ncbi:C40 family peptidase [Glutamicibacter ardleyensis]|uniref:NlpC/P60 domain-containing protein n=1 Tax=Glutamicibacter ardleyensis TaxID=225894 RepID=A0ABQ2DRU2_9MICC|nr:C40 family peptidase [Glutamicibacter ardleyensis]GGJ69427.1 hypothetical protein GCM10007173_30210 [Glutamicibacter ardleyensis]